MHRTLLFAALANTIPAIGNYLTPIFALVYGVVLLGESLTVSAIIGLASISIALLGGVRILPDLPAADPQRPPRAGARREE